MITFVLLFLTPLAPNPPFDYDAALMRQMSERRVWSTEDINAKGEVTGVVQRVHNIGLGFVIQVVHPYNGTPYRRLNTITAVKRNRDNALSIIGGYGPLP